jgi:hypothetical protein
VIVPPRRSVTRFFIPLIDVLILLFCIFLLMPFVSAPAAPEDQPKEQPKPRPLTKQEELQAQLDEANRRLRQLEKERARPADQYSVRILEIDPATGELFYRDPDRKPVRSQADAELLIARQKSAAGGKDIFFVIPYAGAFPTQPQIDQINQWFGAYRPKFVPAIGS